MAARAARMGLAGIGQPSRHLVALVARQPHQEDPLSSMELPHLVVEAYGTVTPPPEPVELDEDEDKEKPE